MYPLELLVLKCGNLHFLVRMVPFKTNNNIVGVEREIGFVAGLSLDDPPIKLQLNTVVTSDLVI